MFTLRRSHPGEFNMNRFTKRLMILYSFSGKNKLSNFISSFRRNGHFLCENGYRLDFKSSNADGIKELYVFSKVYGAILSDDIGFWNFDQNKQVITSPDYIRFVIRGFDAPTFAETFLNDIHFVGFDLKDKVVVQAGGFIGDTALYYASRGARVYSFEPDINSYYIAKESIQLNPDLENRIVMENFAIGNDENIKFPINPEGSGTSSAYSIEGFDTITIESKSIKKILEEYRIEDPYLLDLDIKGKEFEVIYDESIAEFEIVRLEYTTVINSGKLGERDFLVSKLKGYGFKKFRIFKHNFGNYDLLNHGTILATK